jgi:hypothetical protein
MKFVKYLPLFGYIPIVLTTRTRGSLPDDKNRLFFRADDLIGPFKRLYRAVKTRPLPPEESANKNLLSTENKIIQLMSTYLIPETEIIPLVVSPLPKRIIASTIPFL